jgi:hypothetical protein
MLDFLSATIYDEIDDAKLLFSLWVVPRRTSPLIDNATNCPSTDEVNDCNVHLAVITTKTLSPVQHQLKII